MYKITGLLLQSDCPKCLTYAAFLKPVSIAGTLILPLVNFGRTYCDDKFSSTVIQEDELQKLDLTPSTSSKHRVTRPSYSYSESHKPRYSNKRNSNKLPNQRRPKKSVPTLNEKSLLQWMQEHKNSSNRSSKNTASEQEDPHNTVHHANIENTSTYSWNIRGKDRKDLNEQITSLYRVRYFQGIWTRPFTMSSCTFPLKCGYISEMWLQICPISLQLEEKVQGEILFGQFPVLLALQTMRRKIYRLFMKHGKELCKEGYYADILAIAEKSDIEVAFCDRTSLDTLSKECLHQGVCLEVSRLKAKPLKAGDFQIFQEDLPDRGKPCVWLYLDAVQDPMNLGAILRTSCFMNVEKIFISDNDSCRLSPIVSKASAGALEIMDIYSLKDKDEFFTLLKNNGWSIIGTVGRSSLGRTDKVIELEKLSSISERTIILLGNEGTGLPENIQAHCTVLVSITPGDPGSLHRNLDSLNVSVATGIVLHHVISLNPSRRNVISDCQGASSDS